MKKLSVLFAAAMMVMTVGIAKAQKIATMDVVTVLNAMPEKVKAEKQIDAFAKAKESVLKSEGDKLQATYQKYQKEAASQTAEVNKKREKEMQGKAKKFDALKMKIQNEIIAKQKEAYEPVERKFNAAVAKVAAANGWEYIMDANSSAFIYKNGPDATAKVKAALGIK